MKDKLIQRSSARQSEEAALIKMFKYFDYSDKGSVNFTEFSRVLVKAGMYYPQKQLQALFQDYSVGGSNLLDYRNFTVDLFGEKILRKAHT